MESSLAFVICAAAESHLPYVAQPRRSDTAVTAAVPASVVVKPWVWRRSDSPSIAWLHRPSENTSGSAL